MHSQSCLDQSLPLISLHSQCNDTISSAPQKKNELEGELESWSEEVSKLRSVQPLEVSALKLEKDEIPQAQKDAENAKSKQPAAQSAQEAVSFIL